MEQTLIFLDSFIPKFVGLILLIDFAVMLVIVSKEVVVKL